MYADDTKISGYISSIYDCEVLQNHLDKLNVWCKKWGMGFNPPKCKCMTFARTLNKVNFVYSLDGCILEKVESFNDLGVMVSNDLTWINLELTCQQYC